MTLVLKNTTFINYETLEFSTGDIYVDENGMKLLHGENSDYSSAETLDCTGMYVTKSFVVGHHHAYSALARGMPAPPKNPTNFYEILKYIWWRLDKALDKETVEASALATAIACAKAGSTFVIDHHASPNYIEGSLEILARAFDKVGINHLFCYEISDRDGKEKSEKGLAETERYLQKRQGLVGLHASYTVDDDTMKKAVDLMNKYNSGIHIHVAEAPDDQQKSLELYGRAWLVDRLYDFGVLNSPKTILAHCLHLDEYERKAIAQSPAWVVQNTESNLNNDVGFFSSEGLGDKIMLGTDGMHSDMLRSAQAAYFAGKHYDNIDFAETYRRFVNANRYLSDNGFEGNGNNNLVVLDYDSPTEMNRENFLSHFIFGLNATHVKHVISNGKLIVKDRIIQTVDEAEALSFTKEQANRLWDKLKRTEI